MHSTLAARLQAPSKPLPVINGMSVDVEEWFQVGAFENTLQRSDWDHLPQRVERNVNEILALFERAGVKATFFTLGWVAARHGALMRRIADAGHELASHGWDHARVFTLNAISFRDDVERAKKTIEDAAGSRVTGYRAPSFSIDERTPWAHQILAETGHAYSSSVAPVVHDHYGWPDAPRFAYRPLKDTDFIELPVTTALLGNRRLAAGGGGFFRVLPYGFSRWAIRQVNGRENRPAVFYFHPWEIDPDQPVVRNAPLRSRFRHYTNLGRMASRLERLLSEFNWSRMDVIVDQEKMREATA